MINQEENNMETAIKDNNFKIESLINNNGFEEVFKEEFNKLNLIPIRNTIKFKNENNKENSMVVFNPNLKQARGLYNIIFKFLNTNKNDNLNVVLPSEVVLDMIKEFTYCISYKDRYENLEDIIKSSLFPLEQVQKSLGEIITDIAKINLKIIEELDKQCKESGMDLVQIIKNWDMVL
jgi:hypothetical protein